MISFYVDTHYHDCVYVCIVYLYIIVCVYIYIYITHSVDYHITSGSLNDLCLLCCQIWEHGIDLQKTQLDARFLDGCTHRRQVMNVRIKEQDLAHHPNGPRSG